MTCDEHDAMKRKNPDTATNAEIAAVCLHVSQCQRCRSAHEANLARMKSEVPGVQQLALALKCRRKFDQVKADPESGI